MTNFNSWYIETLGFFSGAQLGKPYVAVERHDKYSITQHSFTTDLAIHGLPLLYLKPTPWRMAVKEMLWFISGSYDYADLHNAGCTWWEPWLRSIAPADFKWPCIDAAPINELLVSDVTLPYKKHYRAFKRISAALAEGDFDSTRLYCSLWPTEQDLPYAALPPCALAYQVTVEQGRLSIAVTQRSADLLCGVPTNVLQYAFLTRLYAEIAGLQVGKLQFNFGDLHVYKSHLLQPEWHELMSETRQYQSEVLERSSSCSKFDGLASLAGEAPGVAQASGLNLSASYKHCGKLDFPVVLVHTNK